MVETRMPSTMAEQVDQAQRWLLGFIERDLERTGLSKRGAALRAGLRQGAVQSIYQGKLPRFGTVAALGQLFEEPVPFSEEEWETLWRWRRGQRGRRERRRKPRITLYCQGYLDNGQQQRSPHCRTSREFAPGEIAHYQRRRHPIDPAARTYRCRPCGIAAAAAGRRKESITLYCQQCSKPFVAFPSTAKSRRFCSRLCQARHRMSRQPRRTEVQCRVWDRLAELKLTQDGLEQRFGLVHGTIRKIFQSDDYRPTAATAPRLAEALKWNVERLLEATGGTYDEWLSNLGKSTIGNVWTVYPPGSPEWQKVCQKRAQTQRGAKRSLKFRLFRSLQASVAMKRRFPSAEELKDLVERHASRLGIDIRTARIMMRELLENPKTREQIKASISIETWTRGVAVLRKLSQTPKHRLRAALQIWVTGKGRFPSDEQLGELAERQASKLGLPVKTTLSMMRDMLYGPRGGRPREEKRFALVDAMVKEAKSAGKRAFWNEIANAVATSESKPVEEVNPESLRRWYADASSRPDRIAEPLIRLTPRRDLWTTEERDTLKRLWPDIDAIVSALPDRSRSAIRYKAPQLGLSSLRDAKGGQ